VDATIVNRLVCPSCRGALALEPFSDRDGGVEEGVLLCASCRVWYPIARGVPVLLDFPVAFHLRFAGEHAANLRRLESLGPPRGEPRPGEVAVQKSFTDEWEPTSSGELSFTYSADDLEQLNRHVWLRWLEREGAGVATVLDAGCGIGRETLALRAVTGAEVFGVDLNLALVGSAAVADAPRGVHFVVASLFALPFPTGSFDLVYSEGVLHHTYSTEDAFRAIAAYVDDDGFLFVWLYALEDHLGHGRGFRGGVMVERALRPLVTRSPPAFRDAFFASATRLAHPVLRPRMRHAESWRRADTETFLRDWLSPPYAHRHGWNEVIGWFEALGFEIVDVQSPSAYMRLFGKPLWGVGMTGRRVSPS
jgi:SAM-dependent methyltransferase